jgi:murein DD-endopeptidase MepM/ murein hydrolase activator NlpD
MDGTVSKVYSDAKGGNQLIITHTNGYKTGYAHLSETDVNVGDSVTQGEQIALTGSTGNVTGPHLHFVLVNPSGAAIDPVGVIF